MRRAYRRRTARSMINAWLKQANRARKFAYYDARHTLFRLVVQWRELAALMDRLNRDDPPVARTLH
jgi:hypothetical protein